MNWINFNARFVIGFYVHNLCVPTSCSTSTNAGTIHFNSGSVFIAEVD